MPNPSPAIVDGVAVSASLLCLAHCLAVPMLAVGLPSLGVLVTHSVLVHLLLLALALPLGLWALVRGRQFSGDGPLLFGIAGFLLMTAALFATGAVERWLTVAGVTLVAIAHVRNWRANQPARSLL